MHLLRCCVIWLIVATAIPARAAEIAGADDASLQAAVEAWLEGENAAPLATLSRLANQGNTAARLFLGSIDRRYGQAYLATLGREAHRNLMRPAFGHGWIATEAADGNPLAEAYFRIAEWNSLPEWIGTAAILLEAGERARVLQFAHVPMAHGRHVSEFLAEIATLDDHAMTWLWFEKWKVDREVDTATISEPAVKGWQRTPWSDADEAAFQAALADRRLPAIFLAWQRDRAEPTPGQHAGRLAAFIDIAALAGLPVAERPGTAELRAAGEILAAEGAGEHYLRPLHDLCAQQCPTTLPMCMHTGVILAGGLVRIADLSSPIETLIPQARWRRSPRARAEVIEATRARSGRNGRPALDWLPHDACFKRLSDATPDATAVRD